MYADVARWLSHTIGASVMALYAIFGLPRPFTPGPFESREIYRLARSPAEDRGLHA